MNFDAFHNRRYDLRSYNCAHFVSEVWEHLTNESIAHKLTGFLRPVKERFVPVSIRHIFKRLERPCTPCIVLMQRRRTPPHVGIYLNGKIFHIKQEGVQLQPIEVVTYGYTSVRFYK